VKTIPEPGAVLLHLVCEREGPVPEELRAWVYDEQGTLWENARIPPEGQLVGKACPDLGTVLIQPGTSQGALRIRIQAWTNGVPVLNGTLTIPQINGGDRTFELVLQTELPGEVDGGFNEKDASGVDRRGVEGDVHTPFEDVKKYDSAALPDRPLDNFNRESEAKSDRRDEVGVDANRDLGVEDLSPDTIPACEAQGLCNKPQGTICKQSAECASGSCADGVCCNNACQGPCRSCNQPSEMGTCHGYPSDTDPMLECPTGSLCNGLGACGPITPPTIENGQPCIASKQCLSGFCADGVCCNTACTGVCKTCASGKCTAVKKADDPPRCTDTKTCDNQGTCVDKK
jgi:hypothetical protein